MRLGKVFLDLLIVCRSLSAVAAVNTFIVRVILQIDLDILTLYFRAKVLSKISRTERREDFRNIALFCYKIGDESLATASWSEAIKLSPYPGTTSGLFRIHAASRVSG